MVTRILAPVVVIPYVKEVTKKVWENKWWSAGFGGKAGTML